MSGRDDTWAGVARNSREALALVGYGIAPRCLPGEPGACGGTFAQHAMAYLGTLKAVADHQLAHLGPLGEQHGEIYWRVRAELEHGDSGAEGTRRPGGCP